LEQRIEKNMQNFISALDTILTSIEKAIPLLSPALLAIFDSIAQQVEMRFPSQDQMSTGALLILHLISPALLQPEEYHVIQGAPSPRVKRGLILLSKLLTNIATQSYFKKENGDKRYISKLNKLIKTNIARIPNLDAPAIRVILYPLYSPFSFLIFSRSKLNPINEQQGLGIELPMQLHADITIHSFLIYITTNEQLLVICWSIIQEKTLQPN